MLYNDVGRLYQLLEDSTLKADYLYNDAGQRTRKTIYQPDGITVDSITIYHYDQMGYLMTETTNTGQLIKDYIWQEGMTPLAQIDDIAGSENIVYLYTDHLMTNRLATNELQQVVWTWEGEAFGNTPAEELTATQVNLRFPGQYFDQETNLHYNWNRYYDPELGRYITSDPIGLDGGFNTFGYVGGNPLNRIDPLGLKSIYEGANEYLGAEWFFIFYGEGYTSVWCTDDCEVEKEMVFQKQCWGLGLGTSATAGWVAGLEGDKCNPKKYEGVFWEFSVALGYSGANLDIGAGVVEAGPAVGLGLVPIMRCDYKFIGYR